MTARFETTRRILALAVPALGALVAQPLFVMTDTAMVGHLGESVLAGLSIGATIITTITGLMVFLAYTTTPTVARRLGAGDRAGAIRAGIDGMWLGLGSGIILLLIGLIVAGPAVSAFTDDPFVYEAAMSYLTVSLWGLPGMLLVIAGTGLLRGLQDTRTPLVVAVGGAVMNVGLNALLIYGAQLGIAGSALGTIISETLMAVVYIIVAVRAANEHDVSLSMGIGKPREALRDSALMILRTVTLRIALLLLVWAGAQLGVSELATLQVTYTVYNVLVFMLDALAIAAQAMIGHDLGAGDRSQVKRLTWTLVWWGIGLGVILMLIVGALSPFLGRLFVNEFAVLDMLPSAFITMAVFLPVGGLVFVLDGVLIGAGDVKYLAIIGIIPLIVFVGLVFLVLGTGADGAAGVNLLWGAFGGYLIARGVTLVARAVTDRWIVLGASR
ncbi:MATE family efflux transporter [Gulosibacter molinativorax]|uniref:MATE family efflux transporter n=1 Tax=Gulosibacter molinativorax TaxID=256821 RepID=UPI0004277AFB|nr:MATE family efflux transporter [Gulosibacter molinativorax]QUY63256.1 DNA-damage-inducible protein F [Gulosibacter molinativorax]